MAKTTSLWLTYISSTGKRYLILDALHARYGPFLRIGKVLGQSSLESAAHPPSEGPNALSINSQGAISLYINAEKSEVYRYPGHQGGTALFFKQDSPDVHRARKRVWSPMFAPGAYVLLLCLLLSARISEEHT